MKFEINDIVVYCGGFPLVFGHQKAGFKRDKIYNRWIIVGIRFNYYQISNSNNFLSEWLNKKYVEKYYKFDKSHLRKKKLKKLNSL